MNIKEQVNLISIGSILASNINLLLILIDEADMSNFSEETRNEVKTFLFRALNCAKQKVEGEMFAVAEQMKA